MNLKRYNNFNENEHKWDSYYKKHDIKIEKSISKHFLSIIIIFNEPLV